MLKLTHILKGCFFVFFWWFRLSVGVSFRRGGFGKYLVANQEKRGEECSGRLSHLSSAPIEQFSFLKFLSISFVPGLR